MQWAVMQTTVGRLAATIGAQPSRRRRFSVLLTLVASGKNAWYGAYALATQVRSQPAQLRSPPPPRALYRVSTFGKVVMQTAVGEL